jgi:hypothetical protein
MPTGCGRTRAHPPIAFHSVRTRAQIPAFARVERDALRQEILPSHTGSPKVCLIGHAVVRHRPTAAALFVFDRRHGIDSRRAACR